MCISPVGRGHARCLAVECAFTPPCTQLLLLPVRTCISLMLQTAFCLLRGSSDERGIASNLRNLHVRVACSQSSSRLARA
eukprot:5766674-Pleurochrysis_carterae.AAC.1